MSTTQNGRTVNRSSSTGIDASLRNGEDHSSLPLVDRHRFLDRCTLADDGMAGDWSSKPHRGSPSGECSSQWPPREPLRG